jgi:hypothetical protein
MLTFVPDPTFPGEQSNDSPDVTDRFIQTQILLLTGSDIRDGVAESLHLGDTLSLTAQQVGATDVVKFGVQARTPGDAARASTAVVQLYDQQRRAALTVQVDAMLRGVDAQLRDLRRSLAGGGGALTAAASNEYSRLFAYRNQLALIGTANDSFAHLVDQPRAQVDDTVGGVVRQVALGLLAGAVTGAALALILQRFRPV